MEIRGRYTFLTAIDGLLVIPQVLDAPKNQVTSETRWQLLRIASATHKRADTRPLTGLRGMPDAETP